MSALEDVREIFGYFEEVWRHWKCNCKTAAINKFETSEEDRGYIRSFQEKCNGNQVRPRDHQLMSLQAAAHLFSYKRRENSVIVILVILS